MVRVAGSAHAIVPVDPVWPKVFSEQPLLPANKPTFHPSPRVSCGPNRNFSISSGAQMARQWEWLPGIAPQLLQLPR